MKKIAVILFSIFILFNCSNTPPKKSVQELKKELYISNQLVDNYINNTGFKKEMAEQTLVAKYFRDKEMLRNVPVNYFIPISTIDNKVELQGMTFYNKQVPQLLLLKIKAPKDIFESITFIYGNDRKEYTIQPLDKYYDYGYDQYLIMLDYKQIKQFYEMMKTRENVEYHIRINDDSEILQIYGNVWDHEEVMANLGLIEMVLNNFKDNLDFLDVLNNRK